MISPPTNPATNDRQLMLRGTQHTTLLHIAAQSLWDGQAILATDGSVKDDVATYAWVISTTNDTVGPDIKGGSLLPPSAPYANCASKRPEAAALYAALQWIELILTKYPDTTNSAGESPPLPIPIDNKSVINDIQRPTDTTTPIFNTMTPDYDIIQAIRKIIPKLPIKLDIFHIKGHQDRTKAFEELSPYAQLNVLADRHAEQLHHTPANHIGMFPQWIPGTEAALFHGNLQITSHVSDYIRTAKHAPTMKTYLIERSQTASGRDSKWTEDIYDNIAWRPMGENLRKLSIGQCIQISKYMNDLLPTAKRLQTFDNKHDGRCFECQQLWEDTNHILQCPGEDRSNQRQESMQTLCLQLNAKKTPKVMTDLICDSIDNWIHRRQISLPNWHQHEPFLNTLTDAFNSQKRIGWDQFLRGRMSKDWATAIGLYYKERKPGTAYTHDNWIRHMINTIWQFSMSLWRQRCATYHGIE